MKTRNTTQKLKGGLVYVVVCLSLLLCSCNKDKTPAPAAAQSTSTSHSNPGNESWSLWIQGDSTSNGTYSINGGLPITMPTGTCSYGGSAWVGVIVNVNKGDKIILNGISTWTKFLQDGYRWEMGIVTNPSSDWWLSAWEDYSAYTNSNPPPWKPYIYAGYSRFINAAGFTDTATGQIVFIVP